MNAPQKEALRELREYGKWYPGCGWTYGGSHRSTEAVLDSLCVLGLAVCDEDTGWIYLPTERLLEREGN